MILSHYSYDQGILATPQVGCVFIGLVMDSMAIFCNFATVIF